MSWRMAISSRSILGRGGNPSGSGISPGASFWHGGDAHVAMIRVRRGNRGAGVIIDSGGLADSCLSFRAKGLLAYLQTLPRGHAIDIKELCSASLEGRAAIKTAIEELIDGGYVEPVEPADSAEAGVEADMAAVDRTARMEDLFGAQQARVIRPSSRMKGDERVGSRVEKDEMHRKIQRVIDHLNVLRERSWKWAQYTPLSAKHAKNVEHVSGRMRDGYSVEQLMLVLEYLAATDGGKEESRRYFNCVTPFNTKNFERNLAMALEWEARGRKTPGRKPPGTSRGKEYYLGSREGDG